MRERKKQGKRIEVGQLITIQTECLWGRKRAQSCCKSNNSRLASVRVYGVERRHNFDVSPSKLLKNTRR